MALFVVRPSVPRFDPTPSTSSTSSQRRGGDTLRKSSSSPSEACLAALAVQIWGCHGVRRGRGKACKRRILHLATVSLEPSVTEKLGRIVIDQELFDQLNFLAAKGQVSSARALFEQILASAKVQNGTVRSSQKSVPLSMLYGTMLKAFCNAGDVRGAEEMAYRAREEDVPMNHKFYGKLLETASKAGDVVMANKWFEESKAAGNRDGVHFNFMVEAYAKAGELDEAKKWIQRTRDAGVPTVTNMFNSLIFAYASRGQMKEAAGVIREMLQEGHDPEVSSFAALAVAAAQEGDDEAAERWMQQSYNQVTTRLQPPVPLNHFPKWLRNSGNLVTTITIASVLRRLAEAEGLKRAEEAYLAASLRLLQSASRKTEAAEKRYNELKVEYTERLAARRKDIQEIIDEMDRKEEEAKLRAEEHLRLVQEQCQQHLQAVREQSAKIKEAVAENVPIATKRTAAAQEFTQQRRAEAQERLVTERGVASIQTTALEEDCCMMVRRKEEREEATKRHFEDFCRGTVADMHHTAEGWHRQADRNSLCDKVSLEQTAWVLGHHYKSRWNYTTAVDTKVTNILQGCLHGRDPKSILPHPSPRSLEPPGDLPLLRPRPLPMLANGLAGNHGA